MTTTEQHRTSTPRSNGFSPKLVTSTEARPGFMTTEFWLSVAMAVTVVIAGYASDDFAIDHAWALASGIIAAYALSRGFAKAGSSDPVIRELDRDIDAR